MNTRHALVVVTCNWSVRTHTIKLQYLIMKIYLMLTHTSMIIAKGELLLLNFPGILETTPVLADVTQLG